MPNIQPQPPLIIYTSVVNGKQYSVQAETVSKAIKIIKQQVQAEQELEVKNKSINNNQ